MKKGLQFVSLLIFQLVLQFNNFYVLILLCHPAGRMVLPFEPLSITFQDVQYYIDTPAVISPALTFFYVRF